MTTVGTSDFFPTTFGPGGVCIQSGSEAPYAARRHDQRGKAVTALCPCGRLVGLDARAHFMTHLAKAETTGATP